MPSPQRAGVAVAEVQPGHVPGEESEAQKGCFTLRMREVYRLLRGFRLASERARVMRVIPPADSTKDQS